MRLLRTCDSSESGGGSPQWRRDRSVRPAAEGNSGGRALVVLGGEEVVGEPPGSVRKLSAVAIGIEEGQGGVSRGEIERRRVELTGDDASAEIELRLLAGEHEGELGKLIRGLVEAIGGRWLPPTVVWGLPERRSSGGGVWRPGCTQRKEKRCK
jgi:hypothetical protein